MKTVKVQPLTQESFSKYGSFENLYQPQTMGVGVGTDNAFYPDVMPLGMSNASACVCHVKRRDNNRDGQKDFSQPPLIAPGKT